MDNEQNTPNLPENENWLDEILGITEPLRELGPDELAVQAAGLTHPNDLELEKILSEDWDSVPDLEELEAPQQEITEELISEEAESLAELDADVKIVTSREESVEESISREVNQYFPNMEQTQVVPTQEITAALETPDAQEQKEPMKVRKVRPLPKKGSGLLGIPHFLSTVIWIGIILLIGLTLGRTGWLCLSDLFAFGKPDQEVVVEITHEDVQVLEDETVQVDIDTIAQKLKEFIESL